MNDVPQFHVAYRPSSRANIAQGKTESRKSRFSFAYPGRVRHMQCVVAERRRIEIERLAKRYSILQEFAANVIDGRWTILKALRSSKKSRSTATITEEAPVS